MIFVVINLIIRLFFYDLELNFDEFKFHYTIKLNEKMY